MLLVRLDKVSLNFGTHVVLDEVDFMLKKGLEKIIDNYDFIIIDCAPSLGLITLNALTAADSVIIPIQCEYYALEGLGQLLNTVRLVQKNLNRKLKLGLIVGRGGSSVMNTYWLPQN